MNNYRTWVVIFSLMQAYAPGQKDEKLTKSIPSIVLAFL